MHKQTPKPQQDYADPRSLQKALYQLLEQIEKRDQKISWMQAERAALVRSQEQTLSETIAEKDALLLHTQAALQAQLTERESQLQGILESRTWKVALFFQRFRNFFIPPQSRREQILRDGLNIIFSPFKKIRKN